MRVRYDASIRHTGTPAAQAGFTYVCFNEARFQHPLPVTASLKVFVANFGWGDSRDELQVGGPAGALGRDALFLGSCLYVCQAHYGHKRAHARVALAHPHLPKMATLSCRSGAISA